MAETDGPTQLLEVCGQRLSRFLHNAKHKHLAWLREVEEQGLRMLERYGPPSRGTSPSPGQLAAPPSTRPCALPAAGGQPRCEAGWALGFAAERLI